MKSVLFSVMMALATFSAVAQEKSNLSKNSFTSAPFENTVPVYQPAEQVTNIDKDGPNTFYINYALYNTTSAVPGTIDGGRLPIVPYAAPIDSEYTSVRVALRPYKGFTDPGDVEGTYVEGNALAPGAKLRIDSIIFPFGHQKSSTSPDNRIYMALAGSTPANFGGSIGTMYVPNTPLVWVDSIVTTTSLSPSGTWFGANSEYTWSVAPNVVVNLSATNHTGISIFTKNMAPGDTLAPGVAYKINGGAAATPLEYNTIFTSSEDAASVYLSPASVYITAKVTYTSQAGLDQLEANGFTIHSLMPNPANAATTIRYELKSPSDVSFVVTDMTGKQVDMVKLNGQSVGTFNHELNTSAYASGFYNVSMRVNNQVYTQKLNVIR